MAEEAKAPAGRAKKKAGTRNNEKPVSLYPLTLEEAVDKLLRVKPGARSSAKGEEP